MYKELEKIEKILNKCDSYRVEIIHKGKTYLVDKEKAEEKEHNTLQQGFKYQVEIIMRRNKK